MKKILIEEIYDKKGLTTKKAYQWQYLARFCTDKKIYHQMPYKFL